MRSCERYLCVLERGGRRKFVENAWLFSWFIIVVLDVRKTCKRKKNRKIKNNHNKYTMLALLYRAWPDKWRVMRNVMCMCAHVWMARLHVNLNKPQTMGILRRWALVSLASLIGRWNSNLSVTVRRIARVRTEKSRWRCGQAVRSRTYCIRIRTICAILTVCAVWNCGSW